MKYPLDIEGGWYNEKQFGQEEQHEQLLTYGYRPWGYYKNLHDGNDCKVKRIVVKPGQRLSYQYHYQREEYWQFTTGRGVVTIDDKDREVSAGDYVRIPVKTKHRIRNDGTEDLIFIEIQSGTYFGEDDIVRLEDDYGRTESKTLEYDPTDPYDEGK